MDAQYVIVGIVVASAAAYIAVRTVNILRKAKRGDRCAGCPLAGACSRKGGQEAAQADGGCGCHN